MPLESIVDPTIRVIPSVKLVNFILNIKNVDDAPSGIVFLCESKKSKKEKIANATLTIEDFRWLIHYLSEYRRTKREKIYFQDLFDDSEVILPTPRETPRNPELEARIQKLTAQQNDREYQAMTKSVDSIRKYHPEDSIAYQMKQINKQLIAIAQFVFSVAAGFAFGFIGIELIVGNLDFGFRLLLGIMFSLIIALAEIYFLALKLNENGFDTSPSTSLTKKSHQD
ncbi:transmembrane protein 199 [Pseudomyrmex gracilis]|uniref:transmembrane protein 199 n=1 Tax=Pseudomyrmex gracilis TaxID=219809 RepID=UPI0009951A94|nr:transmembrane protein 199 [Pseudomyrmex gracilis]